VYEAIANPGPPDEYRGSTFYYFSSLFLKISNQLYQHTTHLEPQPATETFNISTQKSKQFFRRNLRSFTENQKKKEKSRSYTIDNQ
jgi:hypothetical protein